MTVGLTPKTPLSLAVKNPHLTQCVLEPRQCICQMASKSLNYKFIKLPHFIRFVDVSATTAAFIRMTVHRQVSTRRTVSSHRCVEVGRTPRLSSSTYPVHIYDYLLSAVSTPGGGQSF